MALMCENGVYKLKINAKEKRTGSSANLNIAVLANEGKLSFTIDIEDPKFEAHQSSTGKV